jgi:tRNA (cytidine/uridine-2'-O-)-methyltransferase
MAINLVLFQPEIPPNTGNIARTCAVIGARLHLIKPLGFSIDDKSLKRAGLDYWDSMEVVVHENIEEFFEYSKGRDLFFSSTKATKLYTDVTYTDDCYIIFGRETSGLPKDVYVDYKDQLIKIPMRNVEKVRSLNLSNSAAIVAYEAMRQLNFKGLI